jgi:hypothetical protein
VTSTQLQSLLTCPQCSHAQLLTMPMDACVFFHECANCKTLLRPQSGDCCVFCSYGSVSCPPRQQGDPSCCSDDRSSVHSSTSANIGT